MLVAAVVGGSISVCASSVAARPRYLSRVRYYNKHKLVQFWARIRDSTDGTADVPVTVNLATDRTGRQIIASKSVLARATHSHIVRGFFFLGNDAVQRGSTFYCHVLAGADSLRVRRYKLKAF